MSHSVIYVLFKSSQEALRPPPPICGVKEQDRDTHMHSESHHDAVRGARKGEFTLPEDDDQYLRNTPATGCSVSAALLTADACVSRVASPSRALESPPMFSYDVTL